MLSIRTLAALSAAAAALALGACGDDEEPADSGSAATATPTATETPAAMEESGSGETIELAADPGGALKFDKTELTAKAGKLTISFDSQTSVPHAVAVEGNGVDESGETITKSSNKLELDLKAGSYDFYCPVGNHRAEGMEGKLTVN